MRKNKIFLPINISIIIIIFILCFYSCEKREPAAQPIPDEIVKKILEDFSESSEGALNFDCVEYISGQKEKELSEKIAKGIYADNKNENENKDENKSVDLSKIEKYSIRQSKKNPAVEIGIFKLYDKINADYVKDMAHNRIAKIQENNKDDINFLETANDAEARSYGNYVYYVSHPQKDKIFRIIENMLRDDKEA